MASGTRFLDHPTDKDLIIVEDFEDDFPVVHTILPRSLGLRNYAAAAKLAQGDWMLQPLDPRLVEWIEELIANIRKALNEPQDLRS